MTDASIGSGHEFLLFHGTEYEVFQMSNCNGEGNIMSISEDGWNVLKEKYISCFILDRNRAPDFLVYKNIDLYIDNTSKIYRSSMDNTYSILKIYYEH